MRNAQIVDQNLDVGKLSNDLLGSGGGSEIGSQPVHA
jgi:hypothetical protein